MADPIVDALMMTHQAPEPNPVPQHLNTIANFLMGGLQGAGMQMPQFMQSNPIQRAMQNPDNIAAMGIAAPLKGGDVFAQRIRDLVAQMPDTGVHEGKVAIGEVYDAYRKAHPREYESPKGFGYRLVNAAKDQKLDLARLDLPETMDKDLRLRSATPWGDDTVHFVRKP